MRSVFRASRDLAVNPARRVPPAKLAKPGLPDPKANEEREASKVIEEILA